MPDRWNWNHLGTNVQCIECGVRGPLWEWPSERREQHAEEHRAARRKTATDAAAERLRHWREEHQP